MDGAESTDGAGCAGVAWQSTPGCGARVCTLPGRLAGLMNNVSTQGWGAPATRTTHTLVGPLFPRVPSPKDEQIVGGTRLLRKLSPYETEPMQTDTRTLSPGRWGHSRQKGRHAVQVANRMGSKAAEEKETISIQREDYFQSPNPQARWQTTVSL